MIIFYPDVKISGFPKFSEFEKKIIFSPQSCILRKLSVYSEIEVENFWNVWALRCWGHIISLKNSLIDFIELFKIYIDESEYLKNKLGWN